MDSTTVLQIVVFGGIILYGLWIANGTAKAMNKARRDPRGVKERWKFDEKYER